MTQARVAVVTDSTADLRPTLRDQLSVTVVPLTVTVGGQSFLDGVEIQPEEFYRRLAASGSIATTSQPSPGMFADAYRQALSNHDQVLSLHISAKLSGTYQAAVQGAELAQMTDRVTVVDTGLVSMPLALVVPSKRSPPRSVRSLVRPTSTSWSAPWSSCAAAAGLDGPVPSSARCCRSNRCSPSLRGRWLRWSAFELGREPSAG